MACRSFLSGYAISALFSSLLDISAASQLYSVYPEHNASSCRYLPGDRGWPSVNEWSKLNDTVGGRLIAAVPEAHVCHDPTYNATACAALQAIWQYPEAHFPYPAEFMAPFQQNTSCSPFTPENQTCTLGNYVSYIINVTDAEDIAAGLRFTEEKNVRLVIKNTGHDYLAKSTGKGALSLWTHNLKSISFSNYTSDAYSGPAVKMGAGVQAFELYEAASAKGLRALGGECITVGVAGGYTQGGGHSMLTSVYGMGADQALEWEVVTANGTLVKASPTSNSDLYWALTGGGGGSYGVVLSLTAKAYPDGIVGGASMSFTSTNFSADTFWETAADFQATFIPTFVDAGAHVQWAIVPLGPDVFYFLLTELTLPGATEDDIQKLLGPWTTYLTAHNIAYDLNVTSYSGFLDHVDHYVGPLPYGTTPGAQIGGGFMVSRSVVANNNTDLVAALRNLYATSSFGIAAYALNANHPISSPNAVHPGWRDLLINYLVLQLWNYTEPYVEWVQPELSLSSEVMPPLKKFGSGMYMNEADFLEPDWKKEFYDDNYDRLRSIKKVWDPKDLFYATTAVGSDAWTVADDGRLCRA